LVIRFEGTGAIVASDAECGMKARQSTAGCHCGQASYDVPAIVFVDWRGDTGSAVILATVAIFLALVAAIHGIRAIMVLAIFQFASSAR
jgi:hypothetical protein